VIVKGVGNYGDRSQSSSDEWVSFASTMAASVVANLLIDPVIFQEWLHYNQGKCYYWKRFPSIAPFLLVLYAAVFSVVTPRH